MLIDMSDRVAQMLLDEMGSQYVDLTYMVAKCEAYGSDVDADTAGRIKDLESLFRSIGLGQHSDDVTLDSDLTFVTEYEVTREYGGPEEGGWYYDALHFVRVHDVLPKEEADERCRQLNKSLPEPKRYSVRRDTDTTYATEPFPRKRATRHRPIWS